MGESGGAPHLFSGLSAVVGTLSSSRAGPAIYRERVGGVVLIAATDGIGTGAVVSREGHIITSAHIVDKPHRARGAEWVAVWFKPSNKVVIDQTAFLIARVVHRDTLRDLAVLRITPWKPIDSAVIPLADTLPDVGQDVFVIGHLQNYLWSFLRGTVSQIRSEHRWVSRDNVARTATAIQAQGSVSPGSSGGPIFDERGLLVGLVVGAPPDAGGLFFAVAVHHIRDVLRQNHR